MTHEPQTFQSPKYNLSTKRQKQRVIKRWVIAIVVALIVIWGFAGMPAPVSYTHLTLPTNREV